MTSLSTTRTRRAFVILNPAAGRGTTDELRDILGQLFSGEGEDRETSDALCEIHETHKDESISELVHGAIDRG
ncbi:diacylglycerol/lipid kinase family protein, partial [Singulisphaera rosea]